MITLAEYTRRFDMIMQAFRAGILSRSQASEAMRELSALRILR